MVNVFSARLHRKSRVMLGVVLLIFAASGCSQSNALNTRPITKHQPIVEELIGILEVKPDLKETPEESIRRAGCLSASTLTVDYEFSDEMVTMIPNNRNLLPKMLEFYYLIDQSPDGKLQKDNLFQQGMLKFAEGWGSFLGGKMLHDIAEIMRNNPQIVLFLALAMGYFAGRKLKIFGFSLGTTVSVLLVALVVGQVGIEVPAVLKSISFALFIFCIGYKVGPQFFGMLKGEGLHYLWISLVVVFTALGTAIGLGKILHFDKGTTAGMLAGSVTTSAALGTAEGAIRHLPITGDKKNALDTDVAVAYAITYIFGTAGTIIFLKMVPRFWKIDLKEEAKKLQAQMGAGPDSLDKPELFSWAKQLDLRAYSIKNKDIIGKKVSEVESLFPGRVAIDKIKRADQVVSPAPDTVIESEDILVIVASYSQFMKASDIIGPEVDRSNVGDLIGEVMEVCILNKEVVGKTLDKLSKNKLAHGVFLRRATRQGHEIPVTRDTVVHKCDVLQFIGAKDDVERVVKFLGYAERPTIITDLATVAIGCVLGTLLGLIVVPVFGFPITLGVGGGVLVAGLICGRLRALHPTFGQIPSAAQWLLSDLGLNLFIACVGVAAGPQAVHAFKTNGPTIFLAGIAVTLIPIIAGLFFGRKVLKMNPLLLLGALTGAHNITAALNMLTEESKSSIPVLGYAVPYAFANVLLTIWGSVIVNVM